jgi:Cft2 family RNA processing exonuclease
MRNEESLIDGLHREYGPDYAFLPDSERQKIETAKAPFDKIDLILVSHLHLDHFHAQSVGLYLQHNPRAVLVPLTRLLTRWRRALKTISRFKRV